MPSETKTTYYDNGQKESEFNYKNGKPDGRFTYWYENGNKSDERNYKNGKLNGEWNEWYKNGRKKIERYWSFNEVTQTTEWYETGKKKVDHVLFKRKTWWHENGNLKKEENYKKVKWLQGRWTEILYGNYTEWYENGHLKKEVNYINSSTSDNNYKKDKVIEWYENRQKEWEKHLKDGSWIIIGWDEDGKCTFGCD